MFGWDLGGMAGLLFAARTPTLRALVSFESGIVEPGHIRTQLAYDFASVNCALLHATRPIEELTARGFEEDLSLLQSLDWIERVIVRPPGMRHADFSTTGFLEGVAPGFWGPYNGRPHATIAALVELANHFLKAKLLGESSAAASLAPAVATMEGVVWPARSSAISFDAFAALALAPDREGELGAAADALQASRGVDEHSMERLGAELLYRRRRTSAAALVIAAGQRLFPQSQGLRDLAQQPAQ
jgi:hypothetical protein